MYSAAQQPLLQLQHVRPACMKFSWAASAFKVFFCFVADFSRVMMDETWLVPSMGFPRLPFPIIETEIPLLLGSISSSVKTCACIVFAFVSVGRVTITEYRTCAITSSFSWQLAETG